MSLGTETLESKRYWTWPEPHHLATGDPGEHMVLSRSMSEVGWQLSLTHRVITRFPHHVFDPMQVMNEYQLLLGWWNFTFHWHFPFFQTPWAHWLVIYNHKTPTSGIQQAVNKHSCLSHRLITLLTCEHAPQPAHKYRRSDWAFNSVSSTACSTALGFQQMLPERPKRIAKGWLCLWNRVTRAPGTFIAQPPVESIPTRNTAKPNQSSGRWFKPQVTRSNLSRLCNTHLLSPLCQARGWTRPFRWFAMPLLGWRERSSGDSA